MFAASIYTAQPLKNFRSTKADSSWCHNVDAKHVTPEILFIYIYYSHFYDLPFNFTFPDLAVKRANVTLLRQTINYPSPKFQVLFLLGVELGDSHCWTLVLLDLARTDSKFVQRGWRMFVTSCGFHWPVDKRALRGLGVTLSWEKSLICLKSQKKHNLIFSVLP